MKQNLGGEADPGASLLQAAEALQRAATSLHPIANPPASGGVLGPGWIFAFLVALGFGTSLAAVVYAVKVRRSPAALAQALGGGSLVSTGVAALSTRIGGLSFQLTWVEAAAFAGFWFILGAIFWLALIALFVRICITGPLVKRFGPVHGVRVWVELVSGVEPLRAWVQQSIRNAQADDVWDEFACAFQEVHGSLDGSLRGANIAARALSLLGHSEDATAQTNKAIRFLREHLGPPIQLLTSRLTQTTLNFTVWRVAETGDEIEHLTSLPVEPGHEAGHGLKTCLPIWANTGKCESGSLAAAAMLERGYRVLSAGEPERRWPPRQLGSRYDAVAAMPVPCDGDGEAPWAVICVESREGTIPLRSHAMRLLMGQLARVVHETRGIVRRRTIDQSRGVDPQVAPEVTSSRADAGGIPSTATLPLHDTIGIKPLTPAEPALSGNGNRGAVNHADSVGAAPKENGHESR